LTAFAKLESEAWNQREIMMSRTDCDGIRLYVGQCGVDITTPKLKIHVCIIKCLGSRVPLDSPERAL
jgi:hypothetical protein